MIFSTYKTPLISLSMLLIALSTISVAVGGEREPIANILSAQEARQGWTILFDVQSTEQWRGVHVANFPSVG